MKTPKELQTRFPYMFGGKHLGIGIAKGWFQSFETLCQDIDALLGEDKRGFHWIQVKEKFGAARFYWELGAYRGPFRVDIQTPQGVLSYEQYPPGQERDEYTVELMQQISTLVQTAETGTRTLCAACGEPGNLDNTDRCLLTLCTPHAAQRKKIPRPDLDLWFEPEDDFSWLA